MKSKTVIIPGILTIKPDEFVEHLKIAKELTDSVHLDLIENDFCPGHSIKFDLMPEITTKYSEIHLMVKKPLDYLETVKKKKITRAIIHVESDYSIGDLAYRARELDILLGFAVNPDTDLAKLIPLLGYSNYIQIMGVNPGYSGQKMDPHTPLAISYLKKIPSHRVIISVDGGIHTDNIGKVYMAGADYIICDSAIFHNEKFQQNYDKLVEAVEDVA